MLFQLEKGEISEVEFFSLLEGVLGGDVTLEGFGDHYFEHLHPNDEMIELMRRLRDRGLRMALLTNNVREWEPLWRAKLPDIDEIFEVVVDSAFVGMRKPEPGIYELTLERLGGGVEDGVGGVVVAFGGQPGGLPDLADGARAEADDPAGEQRLEGGEDAGVEAIAEGLYQGGERRNKLIHGADLRAVNGPGATQHPQDTDFARDGPLSFYHLRLL